jgi:hypothetical protein
VVEYLPSKCEALSSNNNTDKKKKKEKFRFFPDKQKLREFVTNRSAKSRGGVPLRLKWKNIRQ